MKWYERIASRRVAITSAMGAALAAYVSAINELGHDALLAVEK
jgi:hypothetical protein